MSDKLPELADDASTEWFPAPGIIARRGDRLIVNRSNLGDVEILKLGLLTMAGLGRMPTQAEADAVVRWAVRARHDGGRQEQALLGVLEFELPILPMFDAVQDAWLILPQLPPEWLEGLN